MKSGIRITREYCTDEVNFQIAIKRLTAFVKRKIEESHQGARAVVNRKLCDRRKEVTPMLSDPEQRKEPPNKNLLEAHREIMESFISKCALLGMTYSEAMDLLSKIEAELSFRSRFIQM